MSKQKTKLKINFRHILFSIFGVALVGTLGFLLFQGMKESNAANMSGFWAGNIMSDEVMSDYTSMSEGEIQNWLNVNNPCNNYDRALYEEQSRLYPNVKWHFTDHFICMSEERFGNGTVIGSGDTAAHIIWQAAQDYRINPKVLLVLLQKENGLVTDNFPHSGQYKTATGFGCPDTAPCEEEYFGFKNQIRRASGLFREVLDGGWSNYPAYQDNYVQYNPNAGCGGTVIHIDNRATSALYRYTPYQPNGAALATDYGTGDACSAYGNRNFYSYYTDWFGDIHNTGPAGQVVYIPDGIYHITSDMNENKAIDIKDGGTFDGANVQIWDNNGTGAQKWKIARADGDYYTLQNPQSGRYLDLNGGSIANGTNVQIWGYDNNCAHKWKFVESSDGSVSIVSACSNSKVLDLADFNTANGSNIQIWDAVNGTNQKWRLKSTVFANDVYIITSNMDQNKAIDIKDGGTFDGANVQIWDNNGTGAQKWETSQTGDGYYTLKNPQSGRYLDLNGGSIANGTNVQIWGYDNNCAHKWKFVENSEGSMAIVSACSNGKVLDLADFSTLNGANIQIWDAVNGKNQKWKVSKAKPTIPDGIYTITSAMNNNKAIDIKDGGTFDGANVQIWDNNGTGAQKWQIKSIGDGYYTLQNPQSGRYLDLNGGSIANGTNVQIWGYDNNCAHKWRILNSSDGYVSIISSCSNQKALDIADFSHSNGANIQIWDNANSSNQKWKLNKQF